MTYSIVPYKGKTLPKEYEAVIYAKWLRSLRHGNDYFKLVTPDEFYKTYHRYITKILSSPDAIVTIAVLTDDYDVVLGFSISRNNILDYVYVHKDQRRQGIAKNLVPKGIDTITHLTKTALSIWGSKYGHWRFNPFA